MLIYCVLFIFIITLSLLYDEEIVSPDGVLLLFHTQRSSVVMERSVVNMVEIQHSQKGEGVESLIENFEVLIISSQQHAEPDLAGSNLR